MVVPSCLVPSPGMIKAEEYFLLGCMPDRRTMALVWLVCISRACSRLDTLLSLRTGWHWKGQPLTRWRHFPRCQNIAYRKQKVYYNTPDCLSHLPWLLQSLGFQVTIPSGIWFENILNVPDHLISRRSSYYLPESLNLSLFWFLTSLI